MNAGVLGARCHAAASRQRETEGALIGKLVRACVQCSTMIPKENDSIVRIDDASTQWTTHWSSEAIELNRAIS